MTLTEFLLARIADDEAVTRMVAEHPDFTPQPFTSARVLAECDAKRRIVEASRRYSDGRRWALRILAAVYIDHPDYREEWRP